MQVIDERNPPSLADDLLRTIAAIAVFAGLTEREAYYQAENGILPVFKEGRTWVMRKSTYLRHLEQREAEAMAAREAKKARVKAA